MLIESRSESAFLNIIILTLAFMLFISVHLPPLLKWQGKTL